MNRIEAAQPHQDRRSSPPIQYRLAHSLTIDDLLGEVRSLRLWIIIATVLGMLFGVGYAYTRDRVFEATSEILINPRGLEVVDRNLNRQGETSDANLAWVESQMRVISSREVLDAVIVAEQLEDDPEFTQSRPSLRSIITGLLPIKRESRPRSVLSELAKSVAVRRAALSYVVEIHVRTRSPEKSARLADAIAEAYIASLDQNQAEISRRASASLVERAEGLRAAVTDANNKVQDFLAENNIVLTRGSLVSDGTLEQTNTQLVQSERTLDEVRARRDQIAIARRNGDISSVPEILASPAMAEVRGRYQAAVEARAVLATDLLPRHPRLIAANRHVEEARGAVNAEMARIADAVDIEYRRAQVAHEDVRQRLNQMENQSFSTGHALVRLRELQRDLEAKRNVYESFMQRATEVAEQEQLPFNASRIISPAILPVDATGPGNMIILVIATAAGAVFGIVAVLFRAIFMAGGSAPAPVAPPAPPVRRHRYA